MSIPLLGRAAAPLAGPRLDVIVTHAVPSPERCHLINATLARLARDPSVGRVCVQTKCRHIALLHIPMDPRLPATPDSQRKRHILAQQYVGYGPDPYVLLDDDVRPFPTTLGGTPWGVYVLDVFARHPNIALIAPYCLPDPVNHPSMAHELLDAVCGGMRVLRRQAFEAKDLTAPVPPDGKYDAAFCDALAGRSVVAQRWWAQHDGFALPRPGGRYWREGFAGAP